MKFIFFGSPDRARIVLEEMASRDIFPQAIVTRADKPVGRQQLLTQTEVADFANKHNIALYKPANKAELLELHNELESYQCEFIISVAYGLIIPDQILDLASVAPINVHYSLLPAYRGASPVVSQILNQESTAGYTIMKMIAELDAGGIYYQHKFAMPDPLPTTPELAGTLSHLAGQELPLIMEQIKAGQLQPMAQNDELATYCTKLQKADGEINLNESPSLIYAKYKAFYPWPGIYFFANKDNKKIRIKINHLDLVNNTVEITKVTPEGKKPMNWEQFCNWYGSDLLA